MSLFDALVLDIVGDLISSGVLAANYNATYSCYNYAAQMMIKNSMFCLYLWAFPWICQWWRRCVSHRLITHGFELPLTRTSFSWFKLPMYSTKATKNPPPSKRAPSTTMQALLLIKSTFVTCCEVNRGSHHSRFFSRKDTPEKENHPENHAPVHYQYPSFWLWPKRKFVEVGEERSDIEETYTSKRETPLQPSKSALFSKVVIGDNFMRDFP